MKSLDNWPRVKVVLEGALACGDADRDAYLAEACRTDAALRAQVERLLAARDDAGTFLETPAAALLNEPHEREDLTGRVVSSYRLLSRLGAGGSSLQQSQRLLEQAIALDPTFAHAHALLGRLLAYSVANFPDDTAADLARAEASAQAALRINPQLSEAWTALGAAYTQGGRNEDAIGALRRALEIAPNSELALDTLGYACHYAGLLEKAEDATRRTRELNPTSRRLRWMHARFLLYLDRIPEAIALMEFARSTENSKALAHLGKLLYYDSQLDAAEDVFERALTLAKPSEEPAVFVLSAFAAPLNWGTITIPGSPATRTTILFAAILNTRASSPTSAVGGSDTAACSTISGFDAESTTRMSSGHSFDAGLPTPAAARAATAAASARIVAALSGMCCAS
jgi:tetratricopeptide (TPR) repeat protein